MKTEKKLIALSVLAIIIGIASIAPALFLMTGTAKADIDSDKPWFNVDIPWAYFVTFNGSQKGLPQSDYWINITQETEMPNYEGINESNLVSERHSIVLNFTLNHGAVDDISDARFEYYEIQVYSDKGPIYNTSYFIGTNRTNSFDLKAESFHFMRDDWFDSNTTGGGMFTYQWNASGSADTSTIAGSGCGTIGSSGTSREVTAFRAAETVYIDIRRIGWVTFNGNSTVVTLTDNQVLQHIQLEKNGETFLYNALFPADELSQVDLSWPTRSLNQQP